MTLGTASAPGPSVDWTPFPHLLVRLPAIPRSWLGRYRHEALLAMQSQACRLRRRLQKDGNELSRQLGMLVPALDDLESRRQFLAARRALFNARELPGGAWQETLRRRDEPLADAVEAWNRRHFAWRRLLNARDERFAADRETCDRELMRLCRQDAIRRGIALVHNGLASELSSSGEDGRYSCSGRRDRKLMSSAARYLWRAAMRPIPCSSFAGTALARLVEEAGPQLPALQQRRSQVQANRAILRSLVVVLLEFEAVAERLDLQLAADCFADDEGCWAIPPDSPGGLYRGKMEPRDCSNC